MKQNHLAAALALVGAAIAIPIPLAQLDFAGVFNVFDIHAGDTPTAVRVIAGGGGVLTIGVIALALAGAVLAFRGSAGRPVLTVAALAGLVTAFPVWVPSAVLLGAAAFVADQTDRVRLARA